VAAPHRHHFIPAFYLARWAGLNDELIEWSRPHKKIVPMRRHPNATGYQNNLYTFPGLLPESRQWFEERFLKSTDDHAAQALTRILRGRMHTLDDRRKSAWARFLMTLRFRHPDVVVEMRDQIATLWKNHDAFTRSPYAETRSPDDPETFGEYVAQLSPDADFRVQLDLLVAVMDNEQLGRRLVGMPWCVIDVSDAAYRLLTSDWPIELSLGATPPVVSLPLDPTRLFIASDDLSLFERLDRADPNTLVEHMNRYVVGSARRYVFSIDESQKRFIENHMSERMAEQPFFPNVQSLFRDRETG
jgi:hypothetical protein